MRLTAILAAALMMGSAAVSAHATTYTWDAGQDTGTFTTGAMSSVDSGYYLLTDFFFATVDAGDAVFVDQDFSGANIVSDAAFDPSTEQFINHYIGNTYHDSGDFNTDAIEILGVKVGQNVTAFDISSSAVGVSTLPFEITAGLPMPPPVSPAPEPSTWLLMMAGVAMLGGILRRNKRELGSLTGAAAL